jgi:arylsulfatase A-like enzyme
MALPEELHHSAWVADRAVAFLEEAARREEPFFLWVSFPDPHHPYCPPAPWCDLYDPATVALPNRREGELAELPPHFTKVLEEGLPLSGRFAATRMPDDQLREIIALTYGMISLMDHHLGRVLDALDRLGLRQQTACSFLSDHGDMMGDHWLINKGPFHFGGLLRVPFIWSWPGHLQAGAETDALASQLDFAPTVLDLAGVPIPEGPVPAKPECPSMPPPWPGVSLAPLLRGEVQSVQESVVIENDEDYLGLRLRTLVTERHKITVYPGEQYGELFDLQDDLQELHNLWEDPRYQTLKRHLRGELMERLVLTDSPLPRRLCHA